MVTKILVDKELNRYYSKDILIFPEPKKIASLISDLAWKILNLINKTPMYPNQIAQILKINEQKVYYHIHQMKANGLIEVVREEEKNGALCKYFAPTAHAFGVELPSSKKEIILNKNTAETEIRDFFYDFISTGELNGSIVVGSPTTHGPYLTAARDGHYAVQLGLLLGQFCSIGKEFSVVLDTDLKLEKMQKQNLIVVGGPVTNIICSELNTKVNFFVWDKIWKITHKNKTFTEDGAGVIAKIKNPWDTTKTIILVSGRDFLGTKACILAITKFSKEILKDYNRNKEFVKVIQGLDLDGDGKIEKIKVLA